MLTGDSESHRTLVAGPDVDYCVVGRGAIIVHDEVLRTGSDIA